LAAPVAWGLWAEPLLRAQPDAPELPPAAAHGVAAGHAAAPPRVGPGELAVLRPAELGGAAVRLRAGPGELVVPRRAEPGEGVVLRGEGVAPRDGAGARQREGPDAAVPPPVVPAAVAFPWAAAWAFRRDRFRPAVRRRTAPPSARATRSLRMASS
jgi:hypothetical protein